jgi:hypothetical protein
MQFGLTATAEGGTPEEIQSASGELDERTYPQISGEINLSELHEQAFRRLGGTTKVVVPDDRKKACSSPTKANLTRSF